MGRGFASFVFADRITRENAEEAKVGGVARLEILQFFEVCLPLCCMICHQIAAPLDRIWHIDCV